MEQLKTYAVPLVALVLLLLWFFAIRPALDDSEAGMDNQGEDGKKAPSASP